MPAKLFGNPPNLFMYPVIFLMLILAQSDHLPKWIYQPKNLLKLKCVTNQMIGDEPHHHTDKGIEQPPSDGFFK